MSPLTEDEPRTREPAPTPVRRGAGETFALAVRRGLSGELPGPLLPALPGGRARCSRRACPCPGPPSPGSVRFLAAVVVLATTQGRAGVRRLLASMVQWRVPGRAYLAGIGLPLVVSGTAILATLASGRIDRRRRPRALWPSVPVVLLLVLLIPGTGGAWEEPGWRASPSVAWNGGSA